MNASRRGLKSSLGLLLSSILTLTCAATLAGCASSESNPKGRNAVAPSSSASTASSASTPSEESVDARTRSFIDLMSQGKYDAAEARFDNTMKGALPSSKLEETWKAVESKLGHLKSVEKIEQKTVDGYVVSLATTQFERDRIIIKIAFNAEKEIGGLFFLPAPVAWSAPSYANPSAFEEHDINVGSSPALPGTLTMPKGKGPFPAIVLVHGSGPNDRDETIAAIKPFKDLAWGLATNGIAVLRYDKRSKVHPAGIVTQKEEVLDAAHEAVELLKKTPSIDPARVFVAGHTQGGYLAPRIAQGNPSLAGVVILAGSTQPLEDSIVEQLTYFSTLDPNNSHLKEQLAKAKQFKEVVEAKGLKADEDVALPFGGKVTGAYSSTCAAMSRKPRPPSSHADFSSSKASAITK